MSATQIGALTTAQLIRQPGETITMDAVGGFKAQVTFECAWKDYPSLIPKKLDPHPDFPQLLLNQSQTTRIEGDIASIQCSYQGLLSNNNQDLPPTEYSLQTTNNQEPIDVHPFFASAGLDDRQLVNQILSATEQQKYNEGVTALYAYKWPNDASGNASTKQAPNNSSRYAAIQLFQYKAAGITSYYMPTQIFTISYASYARPSKSGDVGKILTPSNAPTLNNGKNWLFMGQTWKRAGGYYQIQETYQASYDGGWNTTLYTNKKTTSNDPFNLGRWSTSGV
jgi:hypothetical protein